MVCFYLEQKCYRASRQFEIPAYLLQVKDVAGLDFEGVIG